MIWQTFPDRSDRFVQEVWPVCPDCLENLSRANFGCQHMPPYFFVTLAYQETFLQAKAILKQREALVHQSHLVSNDEGIQLTTYLSMAQDDGFTLLLIFLHLSWDTNQSTHHFGYYCLEYGPKSISHFKWPWMHKLTQLQWIAIGLLFSIITTESTPALYPWIINLIAKIKEPCSTFLLVQNTPIGLIKEYATITMQMAKIRFTVKN